MAIDADLNGVIANVRNGVGHWKRMATRLARTLAEPQALVRHWSNRTSRGRYFGSEIPARPNGYYAQVAELAGADALVAQAAKYRQQQQCLRAIHLLEMALAAEPGHQGALREQQQCLEVLLEQAKVLNNTYEVMWLQDQLARPAAWLTDS